MNTNETKRSDMESVPSSSGRYDALMAAASKLKRLGAGVARPTAVFFSMAAAGQSMAESGYVPSGASQVIPTVLGTAKDSTKTYTLKCYDNGSGAPTQMRARVQGQTTSAKFLVQLTLEKDGITQTVTDPKLGKGLNFSPYAVVAGGEGTYTMTIRKVKKNASDPDSKLKGGMVFTTRQECNYGPTSGAYTGISKPVEVKTKK